MAKLHPRIAMCVRGLIFMQILAGTEIDLQPVRWWRSPRVLSALQLTPPQSMVIEEFYQGGRAAQWHASEELCELTKQIDERIREGDYDNQLLRLTEKIAKTKSVQREQRRRLRQFANRVLSPRQLETLGTLATGRRLR